MPILRALRDILERSFPKLRGGKIMRALTVCKWVFNGCAAVTLVLVALNMARAETHAFDPWSLLGISTIASTLATSVAGLTLAALGIIDEQRKARK